MLTWPPQSLLSGDWTCELTEGEPWGLVSQEGMGRVGIGTRDWAGTEDATLWFCGQAPPRGGGRFLGPSGGWFPLVLRSLSPEQRGAFREGPGRMVLGWERRTQAHHPLWGNLVLGPEALPGHGAVAYTLGYPHCPLSCPTPIAWADRPALRVVRDTCPASLCWGCGMWRQELF